MGQGMLFHAIGKVFLVVHTKKNPSDAEWDDYLAELEKHKEELEELHTLVFTDGGAPNGAQRKRLNDILANRPFRAAVISNAMIARFVVASMALFNKKIRSFHPGELPLAYKHLHIQEEKIPIIQA